MQESCGGGDDGNGGDGCGKKKKTMCRNCVGDGRGGEGDANGDGGDCNGSGGKSNCMIFYCRW